MIVYLIELLLICIPCYLLRNQGKNKRLCIYSFLVLTFFAALRKETVGVDTLQFVNQFENIGKSDWSFDSFRFEWGYCALNKILYMVFGDRQSLIIASSIFINFGVCYFVYKNTNHLSFAFAIYILSQTYLLYMSMMRTAMAISIILLGYEFFKKKKYFKYCIMIGIALLFHTLSLVALALIPFAMLKLNRKTIYFIVICSLILFDFGRDIFTVLLSIFSKYSYYTNSIYRDSNYFGSLIKFLFVFITFIICIYCIYQSDRKNELFNDDTFKVLFFINLAYIIFSMLTMQVNLFNRLAHVFSIFRIIFIPYCIALIDNNSKRKNITGLTVTLFLAYFIVVGLTRPEWTGAFPYVFFWN